MTRRILILCKSAVGRTMSSPGIRASNIARVLAEALPGSSVTLAAAGSCESDERLPYTLRSYAGGMRSLIRASDVVISQGFPPRALDSFLDRTIIMDFFTNFMVEGLEYRAGRIAPAQREAWLDSQRRYLNLQLTLADFIICANERQRDAWLGMMSSLGLITGDVYDRALPGVDVVGLLDDALVR